MPEGRFRDQAETHDQGCRDAPRLPHAFSLPKLLSRLRPPECGEAEILFGAADAKSPHDVLFYYRGLELEAVRSGPWKLHLAKGELYHLERDIGESANVAAENAAVVERLRALADSMTDDLGLDGRGPGCRPLGKVEDARPLIDHDGTVREGFEPD